MDLLHFEGDLSHATHNRVLLGHLGLNLHLVQLLVAEEDERLHQLACTTEAQEFLYAVVGSSNKYGISKLLPYAHCFN